MISAALIAAVLLTLGLLAALHRESALAQSQPPGPEGAPIPNAVALAPATTTANGGTVDGVECESTEQVLFHIHAHLAVFVDGRARKIPYGIGIEPPWQVERTPSGSFVTGGRCFYWLHTHAADGIIHMESPVQRTFTLGTFFDIWRQPLGKRQVGPAKGKVTVFVDGLRFRGDPREIPLDAHTVIQLDVGAPVVPPKPFTFPSGL